MRLSKSIGSALAGGFAGIINGLFGAGGGMILIPMLSTFADLQGPELFSHSVAIICPLSLVSLCITASQAPLPWDKALPWMISGCIGGILAGIAGKQIPQCWLHRTLGILILYGGIRYLWFTP